jgi:hypothetical protein
MRESAVIPRLPRCACCFACSIIPAIDLSPGGFAGPLCKAVWNTEERCKDEQEQGKRCLLGVVEEGGKGEGDEPGETVIEASGDEDEKRRKRKDKSRERGALSN